MLISERFARIPQADHDRIKMSIFIPDTVILSDKGHIISVLGKIVSHYSTWIIAFNTRYRFEFLYLYSVTITQQFLTMFEYWVLSRHSSQVQLRSMIDSWLAVTACQICVLAVCYHRSLQQIQVVSTFLLTNFCIPCLPWKRDQMNRSAVQVLMALRL